MGISFEEALRQTGTRLAAWNLDTDSEGVRLSIFSLAGGGAEQVAVRWVSFDGKESAAREIQDAGIPLGTYDTWCNFAWLQEGACFSVWSPKSRVFRTDADSIHLEDGKTVSRNGIVAAFSWTDGDCIERGVSLELASGSPVRVAAEVSLLDDEFSSRNDLIFSMHWAVILARELAHFLGVDFRNEIK